MERTSTKVRKKPRQKRSQDTVDAILEATARILQEEGYDKTSTNRVAKVAGVSIGSLYQYFPNKEALIHELFERHHEEMVKMLRTTIQDMGGAPIPVAVRVYVRAMLEAHAVNPRLHQALMQQVVYLEWEYLQELNRTVCAVVQGYLEMHREEILPQNLELAAFVLVSSVESITHTAVSEEQHGIDVDALVDEVCALILRYLLGEIPGG